VIRALRAVVGAEALGARGFNPLPMRGLRRAGSWPSLPGPRGRFQPAPGAPSKPSPPAFRPDVSGSPCWIRRDGASPEEEADERYPLDRPHRPSGRQLDGLPCGGARTSMGGGLNADHSTGR